MNRCQCVGCDCKEIYLDEICDPKTKFYLRDEVVIHNKPNDFWVILHEDVLDLTIFLKTRQDSMTNKYPSKALKLLLQYGGKDLSHYFRPDKTPLTRISSRGNKVPVFPPVLEKSGSDFFGCSLLSWWQDPIYVIGKVTKQPRKIRIVNTLTASTQKMIVCEEDTIDEIQQKYYRYNWNQEKYHWYKYDAEKDLYEELCPNKALTENGFKYEEYREPHTPSLWLYFNDDSEEP